MWDVNLTFNQSSHVRESGRRERVRALIGRVAGRIRDEDSKTDVRDMLIFNVLQFI